MTDSSGFDEWMRAWQSFSGGQAGSPPGPWAAALDHFAKTQQAAYQQPLAEAVTKLTEQSRAFFELGQQIADGEQPDWQQSVFRHLDSLIEQTADPRQSAGWMFGGASPLGYWSRFAGDEAPAAGNRPSFLSQLEKHLQTPGLGYTREYQESVQELSRRWLEHERAYGEYAAYAAETARRSLEKLRGRLRDDFDADRGPDSIRKLYDTWVACSEEVYAERAATREYTVLHGRMVNTLMAYKQQAGRITDQWADALNLPSREEVDALHRKLQDTRQELRALKARLDAATTTGA